ncbi:hypothetical protein Rs2_21945 [Raphanus sativus]|nr:hypothetical protein Rs2_21945 [Raphanus sativus]
MAEKPFRLPPCPPIPPDFGFPSSAPVINPSNLPPPPSPSLLSFFPCSLKLLYYEFPLDSSFPSVWLICFISSSRHAFQHYCSGPSPVDSVMSDAPLQSPQITLDPSAFAPLTHSSQVNHHPSSQQPSTQKSSSQKPPSAAPPENWAKELQRSTDKTLQKVANPTFTAEGIPRIKIPDSVFKKRVDLHQDFIPVVRRRHNATSGVHIHAVMAHFKGIPFDLYTQEGLGRVGDLLGHPLEVDDFTRKMVNINVAHIKCRIDCTKPLRDVERLKETMAKLSKSLSSTLGFLLYALAVGNWVISFLTARTQDGSPKVNLLTTKKQDLKKKQDMKLKIQIAVLLRVLPLRNPP